LDEKERQIIKTAGEKALANRKKGFHCSESVFLAINETFKITDPSMVKMVTGFHGGGGTHRKSELAVELILEASEVVPECKQKA